MAALLGVASFLAESLGDSVLDRVKGALPTPKYNPDDGKHMAFFKRIAQTPEEKDKWQSRKELLTASIDALTRAIESIEHRMDVDDDISADDRGNIAIRALRMLHRETITHLAAILFDANERRVGELVGDFRIAQQGFMECWRDNANVHFYYRLASLRMAFVCDVYRRLLVDKHLNALKIDEYLALVLRKLAKRIQRMKKGSVVLHVFRCIREQNNTDLDNVHGFVRELLMFTDLSIGNIVHKAGNLQAFDQQEQKVSKSEVADVIGWLEKYGGQGLEDTRKSASLAFTRKPLVMAQSLIRDIYRSRFERYNPLYFDVAGYEFKMDLWIPIKVRRLYSDGNSDSASDVFELIEERLAAKRLAIITGVPGSGKTLLTQKIAYDSATPSSKWYKYDIVILADFRATSDRKCDTIIEFAMYGMEQLSGGNSNLCNFIREQLKKKHVDSEKCSVLIILDGYDEAIDGQCVELNNLFNGKDVQLQFDLIVTGRPTSLLKRKENVLNESMIKVIGFGKDERKAYIKQHFASHNIKATVLASVENHIESDEMFRKMAAMPLMLTFICLMYRQLKITARVELYESFVVWLIRQKSSTFPNLLAELASTERVFFGAKAYDMTADDAKETAENWLSLEQIKRLGCISLSLASNKKYQFDRNELHRVQPNMNINVFKKLGIIVGQAEMKGGTEDDDRKYQFAHRTMQDFFAAIFMAKWEDEYHSNAKGDDKKLYHYEEVPPFFVELLLTQRDPMLNSSAIQYLMHAKRITFNIKSPCQLDYINTILNECHQIVQVRINLNKQDVSKTVELRFASAPMAPVRDIELIICDAVFADSISNMISIDAANNLINVNFNRCQFSCQQLVTFAKFISANVAQFRRCANPVKKGTLPNDGGDDTTPSADFDISSRLVFRLQFKSIQSGAPTTNIGSRRSISSASTTDQHTATKNSKTRKKASKMARKRQKKAGIKFCIGNKTLTDEHVAMSFGYDVDSRQHQYDGRLEIRALTTLYSSSSAIYSILCSFSHIRYLYLRLPDPDATVDAALSASLDHLPVFAHLRDIKLSMRKSYQDVPIAGAHWNYVNKILLKCPQLHSVHIWLDGNVIEAPIDLQFVPIKCMIDVEIHDGVFAGNTDANMIHIGDGAQCIDLAFYRRNYSHARLMAFAAYADANAARFERIQFFSPTDNASLMDLVKMSVSGQFANITFKHREKRKEGDEYYKSFYMEKRMGQDAGSYEQMHLLLKKNVRTKIFFLPQ